MSEQDARRLPGETTTTPRSSDAAPANQLGAAFLQRKISRRIQRQKANADPEKTDDGDAKPDYKALYDKVTFKNFLHGGLKTWEEFGPTLLDDKYFGSLEAANKYYAAIASQPVKFLGIVDSEGGYGHKDLVEKLAAAEQLLKTKGWYEALKTGPDRPKGALVLQVRPIAGIKTPSNHCFGAAVDFDAGQNPDTKVAGVGEQLPGGVLHGLTGQGAVNGSAQGKVNETAKDNDKNKVAPSAAADALLPLVQEMRTASDTFKAAFENEGSLKQAMLDYVTNKLAFTMNAATLDLEQVKVAATSGGASRDQLVATLAKAAPKSLDQAQKEQADEYLEDFVSAHGWGGWPAERDRLKAGGAPLIDPAKKVPKQEKKHHHKGEADHKAASQEAAPKEAAPALAPQIYEQYSDALTAVATRAADFLIQMYKIFLDADANRKLGKKGLDAHGDVGHAAAHGYLNHSPKLISVLMAVGLKWLGAAAGRHDFMHFELPSQPSLK